MGTVPWAYLCLARMRGWEGPDGVYWAILDVTTRCCTVYSGRSGTALTASDA